MFLKLYVPCEASLGGYPILEATRLWHTSNIAKKYFRREKANLPAELNYHYVYGQFISQNHFIRT